MNSFAQDLKQSFKSYGVVQRLIVINVAIFLLMYVGDGLLRLFNIFNEPISTFARNWFALPAAPFTFITRPWSLITYQFLHGGIFHILFNMLWLFFMGRLFAEYLGEKKLLAIYFWGGIAGAVFFMLAYNVFPFFSDALPFATVVGASASVLAISVACATLLPDYPVALFVPTFVVKLKYIALFQIAIDLLSVSGSNAGGSIAHLGGALFGFIFIKQLQKGNDLSAWLVKLIDSISGLFNKPKVKVVHKRQTMDEKFNASKKSKQQEVDQILDKISKSGYSSLTSHEKEILFKASKEQ
ncbi:MAG TPA: rhomboid family intramembrane serine protease [Bacteroidia bacterium]|nr:rhomboid family intramembrane serine protease [Bacteroidia bacterium]HNU33107.1 rhomboid family intramembrane serine protease [Bacteroidia bacterium]